jgi:hypothetical protein
MTEQTEMDKILSYDTHSKIKAGIVLHVLLRLNEIEQKMLSELSGKAEGTISYIIHGQSSIWFPNLTRIIIATCGSLVYFFSLFENKEKFEKVLYKYKHKFKYPQDYIDLFLSYWTDNPSPIKDPIKYLFPNGKF